MTRRLWSQVQRCTARIPPELRPALIGWLLSRSLLTLVAWVVRWERGIGRSTGTVYSYNPLVAFWGQFDTGWYLNIAAHGYSATLGTGATTGQGNYAFFPLYPMLVRLLAGIVRDPFAASLVIANVCLLGSCVLLFRMAMARMDPPGARRSVRYLFLYPAAFLLSAALSESLFLFLSLLCLYLGEKRRWRDACLLGFLLCLTRSAGIFVVVPLAYEYLESHQFELRKLRPDLLWLLAPPLGLLCWALYCWWLTGEPTAMFRVQQAWGRQIGNPVTLLREAFESSSLVLRIAAWFTVVHLAALLLGYRRMRPSHWLYCAVSIAVPACMGLMSMPRFILPLFPFYLLAADVTKNRWIDGLLSVTLAGIQAALWSHWCTGRPAVI